MSRRYFFGPHADAQAADIVLPRWKTLTSNIVRWPGPHLELMLLHQLSILAEPVTARPSPQYGPKKPDFVTARPKVGVDLVRHFTLPLAWAVHVTNYRLG
jgi:hypothetical protein